ncbi:MAG: WD40 repeat domain-containing protein [Planctomycetia bacterium]|nr:WD40 repeat domain-containing protein [Planctomycetia bacterium]
MDEETTTDEFTRLFAKATRVLAGTESMQRLVSRDGQFVLNTICDTSATQKRSAKDTILRGVSYKTQLVRKETDEILHEFDAGYDYRSFQFIGSAGRFLCKQHSSVEGLEIWDAETVTKLCSFGQKIFSCFPTADPSGERIIVGSSEGMVSLFSAADGQQIHALIDKKSVRSKPGRAISLTAMNADGTQCLAVDYDGILRLWNTDRGELIYTSPRIPFSPNKVTFLSDGRIKLRGDSASLILDSTQQVETGYKEESTHSITTGERKTLSPTLVLKTIRGGVYSLAVSPDGATAVTSSGVRDNLMVYDLQKRTLMKTIKSNPVWTSHMELRQFARDGKSLYEINEKSFRQISIPEGEVLREWNLPIVDDHSYDPTAWIKGRAIAPDNSCVFICGEERKGLLLNTNDGSIIREIKFKNKRYVLYLPVFSTNGQYIAVTDSSNTIIVFDLEGNVLYEETMKKLDPCPLCWSSDSKSLFIGRKKECVKLDLQSKQIVETYPVKKGNVLAGALSADETCLIINIQATTAQYQNMVVDTTTKKVLFERTTSDDNHYIPVYADGGSVLLVPGDDLQILDAKTFETLHVIEEWPGKVTNFNVFLPDEKSLLFQDGLLSRCINLETGRESGRIGGLTRNDQVVFLPDQKTAVFEISLSSVEICDLSVLKKVKTLSIWHSSNSKPLPLSPDKTKLYAGSENKPAVYSLPSGKKLYDIGQMDDRSANQAVFSPDSRLLLLSFPSGSMALADADSGKIVREMRLDEQIYIDPGIQFHPDGKHFAIYGPNEMIQIYNTETFQLVREYPVDNLREFFTEIHFPPCIDGKAQNWAVWNGTAALEIRDWMTGEKIQSRPYGETDLFCAETDLQRERIYFATVKGEIRILHTGDWRWTDTIHTGVSDLDSLAVSPDGQRLLVLHKNGAELYSTVTFQHLGTIPPRYTSESMPDFLIQLSPGWRWLSVGPSWSTDGENDDELYLYDLSKLE